jgi:hypothetical protein
MKTSKNRLMIEQLDAKLKRFGKEGLADVPPRGWIHVVSKCR